MDFKWLRHNCGILSNLSKNGDIRTKANEIYEFCCNEISDMKKCADCYVHYGSFTSICSPPHILLWVRFSGLTYWPAKLVSIGKGPKPLTVYFFEEYSTAEVSFKDCFLYSKEDPNEWIANNGKERVLNAILVKFLSWDSFRIRWIWILLLIRNLGSRTIHQECRGEVWCISFCTEVQAAGFKRYRWIFGWNNPWFSKSIADSMGKRTNKPNVPWLWWWWNGYDFIKHHVVGYFFGWYSIE